MLRYKFWKVTYSGGLGVDHLFLCSHLFFFYPPLENRFAPFTNSAFFQLTYTVIIYTREKMLSFV